MTDTIAEHADQTLHKGEALVEMSEVGKTYGAIRVHTSPGGLVAALLAAGDARPYVAEPQGEAVAVDASCSAYATLSEGAGQPIVRYSG